MRYLYVVVAAAAMGILASDARAQQPGPLEVTFLQSGAFDITATVDLRRSTRRGGPVLQTATTTVAAVDVGADPMHYIYDSLRLGQVTIDRPGYSPGETPSGAFSMVNQGADNLCIPTDPYFPQSHSIGVEQASGTRA